MPEQLGEKTEQPTQRKLEDAQNRGQLAHSAEMQTVFVLMSGTMALGMFGLQTWQHLTALFVNGLGHLHDSPVRMELMQNYLIGWVVVLAVCTGPVVIATYLGGLLAGGLQSRFRTTPEALTAKWEKLNPMEGLKKMFSVRSALPTVTGLVKLGVVIGLSAAVVKDVFSDPIFHTAVTTERILQFLAESVMKILWRVGLALIVIAAADYGYQLWQIGRDLMMTKQELKEEMKHSEGNPLVKAKMRRRRSLSVNRMLADVPKADVIVRNPTHYAVALRYDRKTMRAPKIIAKGARWNAKRILEVAAAHQVPMVENKPLARMMYKYGRVGSEIPAQFYTAVAEILAWCYRTNRYRYFAEQNQV